MASPVALTIESVSSSDRAELGSSFSKQRSYGTVTEASAALTGSGRLLCGYTVHQVHEQDTLPGLALRYGVTVRPTMCKRDGGERDRESVCLVFFVLKYLVHLQYQYAIYCIDNKYKL